MASPSAARSFAGHFGGRVQGDPRSLEPSQQAGDIAARGAEPQACDADYAPLSRAPAPQQTTVQRLSCVRLFADPGTDLFGSSNSHRVPLLMASTSRGRQ